MDARTQNWPERTHVGLVDLAGGSISISICFCFLLALRSTLRCHFLANRNRGSHPPAWSPGLGLWARRTAGGCFAGRLASCLFPSFFGNTPAIRPNALPPRAILLAKSRYTSGQYADLPPFRGFASWNAHSPSAPLAIQCPTSPAACRCSCLRLESFPLQGGGSR